MHEGAADTDFRELATLRFVTPTMGRKPAGADHPGDVQLEATVGKGAALEFMGALRRNPRVRSGRIRVYLDGEELAIESTDGSFITPEDAAVAVDSLTGDAAVVVDRRQELDRLSRMTGDAMVRLKEAQARADAAERKADAAERKAEDRIRAAMDHADDQIRKARAMDSDAQDFRVRSLQQHDESMVAILNSRRRADEMLGKETWGALLGQIREGLSDLGESPLGKAIGLQISAIASAATMRIMKVKGDDGAEITAADAMAAMVREGRLFNERKGAVLKMAALRPDDTHAQAAQLAVRVVLGDAEPRDLFNLIEKCAAPQE